VTSFVMLAFSAAAAAEVYALVWMETLKLACVGGMRTSPDPPAVTCGGAASAACAAGTRAPRIATRATAAMDVFRFMAWPRAA